jgi:hypothetical protein
VRRQNQRMSRKDDQPSAARAAAFLQRKKRRLVATVLRFWRNEMKQNKQKRLFPDGSPSGLALAFLVLFCHQKSTKDKFFRRKPLKKFLPDLTYSCFVLNFNLKRNSSYFIIIFKNPSLKRAGIFFIWPLRVLFFCIFVKKI